MPASTVTEYLDALPADRRKALEQVRRGINRALPKGYKEGIQWGMISWFVPLATYPAGYGGNKKVALPLVSLASMKNYMALHMVCFYGQPELRERFLAQYAKSGKKLDMGQGCLRFKTLEDLALDLVEKTVAKLPLEKYVAGYQAMRNGKGTTAKRKRDTGKR